MHTASEEWAATVAARNEIETAKAMKNGEWRMENSAFSTLHSTLPKLLPLNAAGKERSDA